MSERTTRAGGANYAPWQPAVTREARPPGRRGCREAGSLGSRATPDRQAPAPRQRCVPGGASRASGRRFRRGRYGS
ncbi:hypothetical protein N864_20945 [Intrasporangium chromatireducens Q5-1]|uniref:Uncharacterized protein n=1 Tax=Intrasporangium chromatireducens Q5-1 TaxID=584657 RepID=W9G5E9_9MICO|nr:hypothetical protein N864_20945 [Intrasporangium chromatireducens Q5-1]